MDSRIFIRNLIREKSVNIELVRKLVSEWSLNEWALREYNKQMDSLGRELTLDEWNKIVEEVY